MSVAIHNPHNIASFAATAHECAGVAVHAIRQDVLGGPAWHEISSDSAMLSVVVDEEGGCCELRHDLSSATLGERRNRPGRGGHMSLIPAGQAVWGYSDRIARMREVRLALDGDVIAAATDGDCPSDLLSRPRLMFLDDRLQRLARLLIDACESGAGEMLFRDGIVIAMLARLARLDIREGIDRGAGLTPGQLTRVKEYINENLAETIRFSELAALAGLSSSQFGRAFKASTGMAPHQWHLQARLDRAMELMADRGRSLVEIALVTGFSEQSHFNRVFRAAMGATPGEWRRNLIH